MRPTVLFYNPISTSPGKQRLPLSLLAVSAVIAADYDVEFIDGNLIADDADPGELLAINDALEQLAQQDAQAVVKLRYFSGLSTEEAAQALGIPRSTAYVHWSFARAALRVLLEGDVDTSS